MKTFTQGNLPNLDWKIAVKKPLLINVAEIIGDSVLIKTPEGDMWGEFGDFIIEDFDRNQFVSYKNNFWISYDFFMDINHFTIFYSINFKKERDANYDFKFFKAVRKPIPVNFSFIDDDFEIIGPKDIMYGKKGDIIIQTPNTNHFYRIYPEIFIKTYMVEN